MNSPLAYCSCDLRWHSCSSQLIGAPISLNNQTPSMPWPIYLPKPLVPAIILKPRWRELTTQLEASVNFNQVTLYNNPEVPDSNIHCVKTWNPKQNHYHINRTMFVGCKWFMIRQLHDDCNQTSAVYTVSWCFLLVQTLHWGCETRGSHRSEFEDYSLLWLGNMQFGR